ncbi:hypothetical protein B484DRAFT_405167, partial [Ochromonadaceae sp. CCMP2298]
SLQKHSQLTWMELLHVLLKYHEYSSMFFGSGQCEEFQSRDTCLSDDSRISSEKLCFWTADSSLDTGGQCSLNQPPEDFIFICLVVLVTVTLCVPITFAYDLLLYNVCFRRPHLDEWGWTNEEEEEVLGRTTQNLSLSKDIKESPIQVRNDNMYMMIVRI